MSLGSGHEKRLEVLERTYGIGDDGGGDGCPRCRATLVVIRDVAGKFRSSKAISSEGTGGLSEEELSERETEKECPRCGRELTGESSARGPQIDIGGRRTR
jgi:hypothetical protein